MLPGVYSSILKVAILRRLKRTLLRSFLRGSTTSSFGESRGGEWNWKRGACIAAMLAPACLATIASSQSDDEGLPHQPLDGATIATLFAGFVREDQLETNAAECEARGKPWSTYHKPLSYPSVIIFPESTSDVSRVLKICNQHSIPVVALGGGTSLEGQIMASRGGVCLDFSRMKAVLEVNDGDLDCTVQPGLGYLELNDMLAPRGVWFPLDPGPGATVGGMCACRCSGSTAVRYGSMRENVLSMTVVLPDGSVLKTGGRARKSSAGYDLTRLFIGSEGTLGIVTEATLKLHTIPALSYAMRLTFPSVEAAAATAKDTLKCGVAIGRCELLDKKMVEIMNQYYHQPGVAKELQEVWPEDTTLLYEIVGLSDSSVQEQMSVVSRIAEVHGCLVNKVLTDASACKQIWRKRKEAIWAAAGLHPDREPMVTDACVPLSGLPELISCSRRWLDESGLPSPIIAHAGDGNIHAVIMVRSENPEEIQLARELSAKMALKAISLGGTCTGEHGIGSGKIELLKQELSPETVGLMKRIKLAVDPSSILNPGKIFDTKLTDPPRRFR